MICFLSVFNIFSLNLNYFRPHGIFFDIHTQAFLILCSIIIYFNNISNKNFKQNNTILYLLISGLLISTSAQNIGIGIVLIIFIYFLLKNKYMKNFVKHIYGKISIFFLVLMRSVKLH